MGWMWHQCQGALEQEITSDRKRYISDTRSQILVLCARGRFMVCRYSPGNPKKIQTEKQMHSSKLRNELFTGDALPGRWWTERYCDVTTKLLFKCIFWTLVSFGFLPFPQLCGNTELQVFYWVNCGIPIGTLVVIGMTGAVHGRRRWEVRCMKEWEAKESQLRDQRKTRVTRKCLLQANVLRTETWHAY